MATKDATASLSTSFEYGAKYLDTFIMGSILYIVYDQMRRAKLVLIQDTIRINVIINIGMLLAHVTILLLVTAPCSTHVPNHGYWSGLGWVGCWIRLSI